MMKRAKILLQPLGVAGFRTDDNIAVSNPFRIGEVSRKASTWMTGAWIVLLRRQSHRAFSAPSGDRARLRRSTKTLQPGSSVTRNIEQI